MRYIRSILAAVCFCLFGIGGFIIGTVIFPFVLLIAPKSKQRYILTDIISFSWKIFIKIMCFFGLIRVKVENKKALKRISGTIIVSNHPSLIDIVILISLIPHSVCIVKSNLAQNPFIKNIIKKIYLVNSDDPEVFLEKAGKILDNGLNLIIFPEGTRTSDNTKQKKPFHRGFAHLALTHQAPILPIHIDTFPKILGKGQKWYDVSDRCSCYQIKVFDQIKVQKKQNLSSHLAAKNLSESVQKMIF